MSKMGNPKKWAGSPIFLGLAQFFKMGSCPFLNSNAILKYLIAIVWGETLLFAHLFGQLSILENGPAQKNWTTCPFFGVAHF